MQTKPTVEFKFRDEFPIEHCDGYLALPLEQALDIKKSYEESIRSKSNEPSKALTTVEKEIEFLGGVGVNEDAPISEIEYECE